MFDKNSRHSIMQRKAPDTSFRLERKRNESSPNFCYLFINNKKVGLTGSLYL